MSAPWTQVLELSWAPELRFYEQRIFLLRELEARQNLAEFRVLDHRIEARLSEKEALEVGPTGASFVLVGPEARLEVVRDVVSLVLKSLDPENVSVSLLAVQFLTTLPDEFEDARRRSTQYVVGPFLEEGARDYALLVDGMSATLQAAFQVELGVVDPHEAPLRIGRFIGRLSDTGRVANRELLPRSAFMRDDYPAAAFFSDWNWYPRMEPRPQGEAEAEVFALWNRVVEESGKMLRKVQVEAGATDQYHGIEEGTT